MGQDIEIIKKAIFLDLVLNFLLLINFQNIAEFWGGELDWNM